MRVTTKEIAETLLGELLFMKGQRPGTKSKMRDIFVKRLVKASKEFFVADTGFLRLEPPIILVGGMFAHFYDLLSLFEAYGYPPAHRYLFLGDIIGNGKENIETLVFLLCHKILYPSFVYILRGYHEVEFVNATDGFRKEVLKRYDEKLYRICNNLFTAFPIAAVVASKIFCVNSGLSPDLLTIAQIERSRMGEIGKSDQIFYLLQAIPDRNVEGWTDEIAPPPARFGIGPVNDFLRHNDLELIVRSHDIVDEGFEFPLDGSEKLLTLSTVPSYMGKIEKPACIVEIDLTLKLIFRPLRPLPTIYRDYYEKKKKVPPLVRLRTKPVK
jgi:serine/threonine-protein phosphatase PP1 catalytic subunit